MCWMNNVSTQIKAWKECCFKKMNRLAIWDHYQKQGQAAFVEGRQYDSALQILQSEGNIDIYSLLWIYQFPINILHGFPRQIGKQ